MSSAGPGRPRHDDVLTPAEWKVAELVRTIQKTNLRKTSLSKLVIQS